MATKTSKKASLVEQINALSTKPEIALLAIIGKDRVRRENVLNRLADILKLKSAQKWAYPVRKLKLSQAREHDLPNFILESSNQSLFTKKQIFFIEELEKASAKQSDLILKLIADKNAGNIFFLSGQSLPENSRLRKALQEKDVLFELQELEAPEFKKWLAQELKNRGLQSDNQALELLYLLSENSADLASQHLEILELYANDQKVTSQMLNEIFTPVNQDRFYDWIKALQGGDKLQAQILMERLLAQGEEAIPMLGAAHVSYYQYLQIAAYRQAGLNQSQIRNKLKMNPWIFDRAFAFAEQNSIDLLNQNLKAFVLADSKLKNKSLGEAEVLNELISNL